MTGGRQFAALIPAAGLSSRMGDFKPLLPLGRSTFIEEAVDRFRRAGIEDVRVVIGHRAEAIAPLLDRLRVRKIINSDYARGMLSSILAGIGSLEPEVDAFFLLPVDIPLVKPATIRTLAKARLSRRTAIIYPRFEGMRGHPPLISRDLAADLQSDYEGGFREFLDRHEELAIDIDVIDQSILMDCDTREEYRKLCAFASREDIPTESECVALLKNHGASDGQIAHGRIVAEVARTFAVHLNCAGLALNIDLITSSGLLHDLAKGQSDHARAGAQILGKMGYGRVAKIVGLHTDLLSKEISLDESELVHLADKFVKGDAIVTLEQRFDGPLKKFAGRPEIAEAVRRRLQEARSVKKRLEDIIGISTEAILEKYRKSLQMASSGQRNIWLARHCAVNTGGVGRYIGHTDLALSAEGIKQAEALAEKLRHLPLRSIYCSDLRRSAETARIIGKLHGIAPMAISGFREVALGEWEGLTFDEVRQRFPEEYEERGRDFATFRPPGGENFLDCSARVLPALYEALRTTRGDILIVGHAGVNRILLCQAMGKPLNELFDITQDYGCLNLILYGDQGFRVEETEWIDT